jgi:hypothetical protein
LLPFYKHKFYNLHQVMILSYANNKFWHCVITFICQMFDPLYPDVSLCSFISYFKFPNSALYCQILSKHMLPFPLYLLCSNLSL